MGEIYGRIIGWGAYTPSQVLTNFDLEQMLDTSDEWIVQRSGIRERRIAAEDETTATLAVNASQMALAKANIPATDLDLIIVATSSPDYLTPPVSSQVQHMLGAAGTPAFVLETGCTGFIYSMITAYQFIATAAYRTILVIGVELLSRHVNWQDRSTAVLFGDAAGAVVIQASDERCGLKGFALGHKSQVLETSFLYHKGSAFSLDPYLTAMSVHKSEIVMWLLSLHNVCGRNDGSLKVFSVYI